MRPALPDVPAVYFVSPTLPNIRRIAEDLEKSLYESFHLNFVEPLPRSLLEELAASVARDGTGELVQEVECCVSDFAHLLITLDRSGYGSILVLHCSFSVLIFTTSTSSTDSLALRYGFPFWYHNPSLYICNPKLSIFH
jgi:hypothetical protein